MKALACLVLCFAPLAMADGGQSAQPVAGKVTLVYFWADWCAPCKPMSRVLEEMAATDADIAVRKVNFSDSGSEEWEQSGVRGLPHVKVYNRGGSLVGTVDGLDIAKVKSYVAQAKGS